MLWRRYVAVGDSFTEGLDDPYPDGSMYRGWADLVAARLAADAATAGTTTPDAAGGAGNGGAPFRYANLAIRGRLFNPIIDEQVPPALGMRPDLVSFAGGGNDALRRGFDGAAMIARFNDTVAALRGSGADVLLFRFADLSLRLPGRRVLRPRLERINDAVVRTAERHGARIVDLWGDQEFVNPALWSGDRLHMSTAGHLRVAAHVLEALDLTPDSAWLATPPSPERARWLAARAADARWAGQHLAPWLKRRLTGRSSGDTRTPKRPDLEPLTVP